MLGQQSWNVNIVNTIKLLGQVISVSGNQNIPVSGLVQDVCLAVDRAPLQELKTSMSSVDLLSGSELSKCCNRVVEWDNYFKHSNLPNLPMTEGKYEDLKKADEMFH